MPNSGTNTNGKMARAIIHMNSTGPADQWKGECYWSTGSFSGHSPQTVGILVFGSLLEAIQMVPAGLSLNIKGVSMTIKH